MVQLYENQSIYLFQPTANRGWIVPLYSGKNAWWTTLVAIAPALIATILVFMDQQITAVIVNRKEFKMKVYKKKFRHNNFKFYLIEKFNLEI